MKPSILCLNGSPSGEDGNSAVIIERVAALAADHCDVEEIELSHGLKFDEIEPFLERAAGFLFVTGTYWDSWGSPLQRFFEVATPSEGSPLWLGKPAACVVSMHAVGGKGVLSRLLGVLNTLGVLIPPMCGMVTSLVNETVLEHEQSWRTEDLWNIDGDLEIVVHNLVQGISKTNNWRSWRVERENFTRAWLK